jgi:deazaflavin-dependent oxidoreductase (nitroreductase family)
LALDVNETHQNHKNQCDGKQNVLPPPEAMRFARDQCCAWQSTTICLTKLRARPPSHGAQIVISTPGEARMTKAVDSQTMKTTPYNQKTIAEFHAKQGRGVGPWGDHVLLMTAKGAKSSEAITTPLVYGREGDHYVIVASKGGAPKNPAWFGNIKANPEVEVEMANANGTEKFKARARLVDSRAERDRLYEEMSKIWPSFKDYEKRTDRLIPVVILERERT